LPVLRDPWHLSAHPLSVQRLRTPGAPRAFSLILEGEAERRPGFLSQFGYSLAEFADSQ
jgi:hypothetical protein